MSKDFPGSSKAAHGTRAGLQMHKAQRSVPCAECRQAGNDYIAEFMRNRYSPDARRARYLKNKEKS